MFFSPKDLPTLLLLCLSFGALNAHGAVVRILDEVEGPTPNLLAYNLGHFHPGSNTADWWRYSRVSGARMFMAASHLEVGWTVRPGDNEVTSEQTFLARRAALRSDPLNADYINWSAVEGRFSTPLSGNNRIVPRYAFEEIHRMGGTTMVQAALGESAFPISGESDWRRKWTAWRVYYSLVFYLAREFGIERFSSHNEPNHVDSLISPDSWMMRVRLASDATQSAIEDVNRIYHRNLTPRFTAPVTAGAGGAAYHDYGRLAVTGIQTNFRGQTHSDHRLLHLYAYQQYNQTPAGFVNNLNSLRNLVSGDLPSGVSLPPFALTEVNVHTGATYDSIPETPDTLSKATRFGAIATSLMRAGIDEFYTFKFGMTAYPSSRNYPVQKNGMLYVDNANVPYNYGTMTRGAEVYRLFNKAFAPGRDRLGFQLTGTGASNLSVAASRDTAGGFSYVFSVNETSSAIPFELDLTALGIPEGNHLILEDVSQWRTGTLRSMHRVANGRVAPGNQPGNTVWLLTIPMHPQRETPDGANRRVLPVTHDAMVKDGSNASANFGASAAAWAKNDPVSVNGRNVAFLQFDLPADFNPARLQLAVVSLPISPIDGGTAYVQAHLYGIDNHDWNEATITWNNAPNLRKNVPAGNEIRHRVVDGAGQTAHILGQLTAAGAYVDRQVDVTDYLRRQTGGKASFMVAQDPRWDIDIHPSTVPESWNDLPRGDTQPDGIRILTREGAAGGQTGATLILIESEATPSAFENWIQLAFPGVTDPAVVAPDADPDGDGLPNLLEFALGRDPAVASRADLPHATVDENGAPLFHFTKNKAGDAIVLTVETSADLVTWSTTGVQVETVSDEGAYFRMLASLSSPRSGERVFFRLKVKDFSP